LGLRQLREMSRDARTPEDHANVACQYRTEAVRLDAVAAKYEEAATIYGSGPIVKNLMAPTTSQRYAFIAQLLRKASDRLRQRASSEDEAACHSAMSR
jgi:hypothetical protein